METTTSKTGTSLKLQLLLRSEAIKQCQQVLLEGITTKARLELKATRLKILTELVNIIGALATVMLKVSKEEDKECKEKIFKLLHWTIKDNAAITTYLNLIGMTLDELYLSIDTSNILLYTDPLKQDIKDDEIGTFHNKFKTDMDSIFFEIRQITIDSVQENLDNIWVEEFAQQLTKGKATVAAVAKVDSEKPTSTATLSKLLDERINKKNQKARKPTTETLQ